MAHAAHAHLARIVGTERVRGVRRLAVVRAVGAGGGLIVVLAFGVVGGDSGFRGTVVPVAAYFAVALVVLLTVRRLPSFARVIGLSVALIDVPMLTLIQRAGLGAADPRYLYTGIGLYCTAVAASAMTLSRLMVVVTCATAVVGVVLLLSSSAAPPQEHILAAIAPITTAAMCIFLVTRIRALVEEARRDDLLGKYILGERIGAGGMAEVLRATYAPEGGFERQVAVKRVLPAYASDVTFIERFRREAELMSQLVHPNIVQVLDFGVHRETYFLAMELVDGVPLSRIPKENLPLSVAVYVALQLAEALDFIHKRIGANGRHMGLVHRDVNPPNVLVSRHGEVKLTDFGVARATATVNLTGTGMLVGKFSYLAPEQLRGEPYDGRADMFALGLTLYELVTGRRAVQATSEVGIVRELLDAAFVRPSAVRTEVPPPFDAIVLGLLEGDVARRSTAEELRRQLTVLSGPYADFQEGREYLASVVVRALEKKAIVPPKNESPTKTEDTALERG